jgi:hypothetical protein
LRRVGAVPGWVVDVAFAVWGAALAALAWILKKLVISLRQTSADS